MNNNPNDQRAQQKNAVNGQHEATGATPSARKQDDNRSMNDKRSGSIEDTVNENGAAANRHRKSSRDTATVEVDNVNEESAGEKDEDNVRGELKNRSRDNSQKDKNNRDRSL